MGVSLVSSLVTAKSLLSACNHLKKCNSRHYVIFSKLKYLQLILKAFILFGECLTVLHGIAYRVDIAFGNQIAPFANVAVLSLVVLSFAFVLRFKMLVDKMTILKPDIE